jgi:lipopolysaccharide export system ATP-binding protein
MIRKTKANRVSGGERRRLEIARSLITEPKLILLDEPFAGIDPKTVNEIQDAIRALAKDRKIGILLTDHNFRETLEVTDRSYMIREGKVFASGTPTELLQDADVKRYYLGERFDTGHMLEKIHLHGHPPAGLEAAPKELVIEHVDDQPPLGSTIIINTAPPGGLNLRVDQEEQDGGDREDPQDHHAEPRGM